MAKGEQRGNREAKEAEEGKAKDNRSRSLAKGHTWRNCRVEEVAAR